MANFGPNHNYTLQKQLSLKETRHSYRKPVINQERRPEIGEDRLSALPTEILENIGSHLKRKEYCRLQLVNRTIQNKTFRAFAKEFLFTVRLESFDSRSLRRLRAFAESDIAKFVLVMRIGRSGRLMDAPQSGPDAVYEREVATMLRERFVNCRHFKVDYVFPKTCGKFFDSAPDKCPERFGTLQPVFRLQRILSYAPEIKIHHFRIRGADFKLAIQSLVLEKYPQLTYSRKELKTYSAQATAKCSSNSSTTTDSYPEQKANLEIVVNGPGTETDLTHHPALVDKNVDELNPYELSPELGNILASSPTIPLIGFWSGLNQMPLRQVRLEKMDFNGPTLGRILRSLPHLESLELRHIGLLSGDWTTTFQWMKCHDCQLKHLTLYELEYMEESLIIFEVSASLIARGACISSSGVRIKIEHFDDFALNIESRRVVWSTAESVEFTETADSELLVSEAKLNYYAPGLTWTGKNPQMLGSVLIKACEDL